MNKQQKKLPWMKFYPADWMADVELRNCSIAARGLWIDLVCVMWMNDPPGFLNGSERPDFAQRLSRMTGIGETESRTLIDELIREGVASLTTQQVMYSRRIVREHAERLEMSRRGSKGGNPLLVPKVNQQVNHVVKQEVNHVVKQEVNHVVNHALHMHMPLQSDSSPPEGGPGETTPEGYFTDAQCESVIAAWNACAQRRLGAAWGPYGADHRNRANLDYRLVALRSQAKHAPQDEAGFVAWLIGQIEAYWASPAAVSKSPDGKMFTATFKGFVYGTTGDGPKALEDPAKWGDRKATGVVLSLAESDAKRAAEDAAIEAKREADRKARESRGSFRAAVEAAAASGNNFVAGLLAQKGTA